MLKLNRFSKIIIFIILALSIPIVIFLIKDPVQYSNDIQIKDGAIISYGKDENVVLNSKYHGEVISKIDVSSVSTTGTKTLTISKSITSISTRSFVSLGNLEAFFVDPENPTYTSVEGVLYNKDKTILIRYPAQKRDETYIIPEGVTKIHPNAFSGNKHLKELTIPESVIRIEEAAFMGMSSLKSIKIPNGVTTIDNSTFENCTNLESITLGTKILRMNFRAFKNCVSLKSIVIPESTISFGGELFYGCKSLENVVLPSNTREILNGMFAYCSSLKGITLPETVTTIYYDAFRGTGIESITLPTSLKRIDIHAFADCTSLTNIVIPENVKEIECFRNCKNLERVTILGSNVNFGAYAFSNCNSLKEFHVKSIDDFVSFSFNNRESNPLNFGATLYIDGEPITNFAFPESTTTINSYLFAGYSLLESVTIPEGVATIGSGAFENCTGIREITLPSSLQSIQMYAFYNCTSLKTMHIPSIEWWLNINLSQKFGLFTHLETLYANNELITEVTIPETYTSIKSYTFYECKVLTKIEIPLSIKYINSHAFAKLDHSTTIVYKGTIEQFKEISINSFAFGDYRYEINCSDGPYTR